MTSMAAALAASLPAAIVPTPVKNVVSGGAKVPARMEGVVDVEGNKEVESVRINSLVRIRGQDGWGLG
jgi:hypothetical protein